MELVSPVPLFSLALGALLLFFGRSLFWLFVAAIGAAAGLHLAQFLLPAHSELFLVLAAAVLAGAGALLAIFVQKLALRVAGFLAGGYGAMHLAALAGLGSSSWIAFICGGLLGLLLITTLFSAALIILSSIAGAALISPLPRLDPGLEAALFAGLALIGIAAQYRLRRQPAS